MKLGLVLSGGGAKGAYESGVIRALKDLGYKFDIVTGTSIGACNGLLVAQGDYDTLYDLWDHISTEFVLKNPVDFKFSIDSMMKQSNLYKSFFKSYINEKGADISPLIKNLYEMYHPEKVTNGTVDYGVVTVKYPSLSPVEISKKDMHENYLEYAIASASCFPAFPVHYIEGQGYIDGGYYDNLPISLAFKMGADNIIAVELNKEATHEYFVNRPNITFIRPSYDLGMFLDFDREVLDFRIKLGYLDTMKTFDQYIGYQYTFKKTEFNEELLNNFYRDVLCYEDDINKTTINKKLNTPTPLLKALKKDTYLTVLKLEDYLLRALEITMSFYEYSPLEVYDVNTVCNEILESFTDNFITSKRTLKEFLVSIKDRSSVEIINFYYHSLVKHEVISASISHTLFEREYLIALFIYHLQKVSNNEPKS